jgi:hypothetical protein
MDQDPRGEVREPDANESKLSKRAVVTGDGG